MQSEEKRGRVIWKFELLNPAGTFFMDVPPIFIPRSVGIDPLGKGVMWAEVVPSSELRQVEIAVLGTGQNIPAADFRYVGTFMAGAFVWHVYFR